MTSINPLVQAPLPISAVEISSAPEAVEVQREGSEDADLEDSETEILDLSDDGQRASPASEVDNEQTPRRRCRKINMESLSPSDQLTLTMKQEGHSAKQISEYLEKNGHGKYRPATINYRYSVMREKIAKSGNEVVWDPKNDFALLECVTTVRDSIAKEQADTEARQWSEVSKKLCNIDRNVPVSSRSCRERYERIMSGELPIYPELKGLGLSRNVMRTQDRMLRAKNAHVESQEEAENQMRKAAERYRLATAPLLVQLQEAAQGSEPAEYSLDVSSQDEEVQEHDSDATITDEEFLGTHVENTTSSTPEVQEHDSDATITDDEFLGNGVENTTISAPEVRAPKIKKRKRSSVGPYVRAYGLDRHVKKVKRAGS